METIEDIYASKFREYDDIQAARGCNQHKHVPGCDEAGGDTDEHAVPANKKIQKLDWKLYEIEKDITLMLRAIRNTQSAKEKSTLKKRLQDLADERIKIAQEIEKLTLSKKNKN